MELNLPKTNTASHEVPIFTQMAHEGNIPVSEVKARFRNKMLDVHDKAMDDPSTIPLGGNVQDMVHIAVNNLRSELAHPEEDNNSDEEEYDELANNDFQAAGADEFADTGDAFDDFGSGDFGGGGDFGGDFGGDLGGDFGGDGGIDNMDLGFSDDGMASLDEVSDDDNGEAAGEVNALSDLEPSSSESDTETESPEGDSDTGFDDFGA